MRLRASRPLDFFGAGNMKKTLLIVCGIAAIIGFARLRVRTAARSEPLCDKPCRWDAVKGYAGCQPLAARLEVKTSPEPTGRGTAVWYRAVVENDSCETISLDSDFFLHNLHARSAVRDAAGTRVVVFDKNGKPLPAGSALVPYESAFHDDGPIHPYAADTAKLSGLTRSRVDEHNPSFLHEELVLPPGATAASSPSVFAPYRVLLTSTKTGNYQTTGLGQAPAQSNDAADLFARPPEGFRRMTGYSIPRKGEYSARFVIDERVRISRPGAGDRDAAWEVNMRIDSQPVRFRIER